MRLKDRPEYNKKAAPVCLTADANVREAVNIMSEKNFGAIIITDKDQKVEGILTERDLMRRLLYNKKDADKTKISEIMTKDVLVAQEDDNLLDWLRIMSNERFRHLPIVDKDGKLVNLMSQGDFVSYTWPELFDRIKENAKATLFGGYQIALVVGALLFYAIIINFLNQ